MIAAQEARDGERERRIREEAYRLWEEAGRPEGRALEHWSEAKRKYEQAEGQGAVAGGHAQVPRETELKGARAQARKTQKPGGRSRKPVSPGG